MGEDAAARLIVVAAQMGPIEPGVPRSEVVGRLVSLLERAAARGAQLVTFPEATLTPFFPHWWVEDDTQLDAYFETDFPDASLDPLFDAARQHGIAFSLGYTEAVRDGGTTRRFNSSALVSPTGEVVGRYRKIHLPGYTEPQRDHPFENLEKRYFEVGNLGLPTWELLGTRIGMCICNDRRWPETYRLLGLQGVEIVLIGYNTPYDNPALPETNRLANFHNHLSMQAGAYQNGTWIVAAAKAGVEAGVHQIGGSCIIAPSGEIVAMATSEGDEVVSAEIDLDQARRYQRTLLNLPVNRQPQHYGPITASPV